MLYSERANPAKVHYLINVRSDWHHVRDCERRCRPTGDVNDYFQVRQRLCHKERYSRLALGETSREKDRAECELLFLFSWAILLLAAQAASEF